MFLRSHVREIVEMNRLQKCEKTLHVILTWENIFVFTIVLCFLSRTRKSSPSADSSVTKKYKQES